MARGKGLLWKPLKRHQDRVTAASMSRELGREPSEQNARPEGLCGRFAPVSVGNRSK